jgi:hypothetical protein
MLRRHQKFIASFIRHGFFNDNDEKSYFSNALRSQLNNNLKLTFLVRIDYKLFVLLKG